MSRLGGIFFCLKVCNAEKPPYLYRTQIHRDMYTLRILREHGESNLELGTSYTLVDRHAHATAFAGALEMHFPEEEYKAFPGIKDRCFAFVVDSQGSHYALFSADVVYIMSDNGATYAHPQPLQWHVPASKE